MNLYLTQEESDYLLDLLNREHQQVLDGPIMDDDQFIVMTLDRLINRLETEERVENV